MHDCRIMGHGKLLLMMMLLRRWLAGLLRSIVVATAYKRRERRRIVDRRRRRRSRTGRKLCGLCVVGVFILPIITNTNQSHMASGVPRGLLLFEIDAMQKVGSCWSLPLQTCGCFCPSCFPSRFQQPLARPSSSALVLICWYPASLCRTACTARGCEVFEEEYRTPYKLGKKAHDISQQI